MYKKSLANYSTCILWVKKRTIYLSGYIPSGVESEMSPRERVYTQFIASKLVNQYGQVS